MYAAHNVDVCVKGRQRGRMNADAPDEKEGMRKREKSKMKKRRREEKRKERQEKRK